MTDVPEGASLPEVAPEGSLVPTGTEDPTEEAPCPNCGAERVGEYCQGCGQHHLTGRLDLRSLFREGLRRLVNLDKGLLHTFVTLTKRPGQVPLDYVEGRRRRYTNPITYFVIASTLSVLLSNFYVDEMIAAQSASLQEQFEAMPDSQREAQVEAIGEDPAAPIRMMMSFMLKYNLYLFGFWALFFALVLRFFFRGERFNTAEHAVYSFYTLGHAAILGNVAAVVFIRLFPSLIMVMSFGTLTLYLAYTAWASRRFYDRKLGTMVVVVISLLISYAAYFVVLMIGFLIWFLGSLLAAEGRTWGEVFGNIWADLTGQPRP